MARLSSDLLQGISGAVGKQLVFKKYGNKTVVTKYPDMSGLVPSELQAEKRRVFAEAVAYARSINGDKLKKAVYQKKVKVGESVYHYALKEYLANHKKQP